MMKIAIIGGGLTGLTAAYRLSKEGHKITLVEKDKRLGGLAANFQTAKAVWPLETFYHHFFTSDRDFQQLIRELGLEKKLVYSRPKTAVFFRGTISRLDSPLSLLASPQFSLPAKIRAGLATAYFKLTGNWQKLEKKLAWPWLKILYGDEVFSRLWQPLLEAKFGPEAKKISLAWFWARIKKRSAQLGYLEGGTQGLIDKLESEIRKNGGRIVMGREFESDNIRLQGEERNFNSTPEKGEKIKEPDRFNRIILTTPTSVFEKIAGDRLPVDYRKSLKKLKMIGAVCLILELKEPLLTDGTYWLNVNEPGFPFVAVVEHTNMIDPGHYGGSRIVYVGGYYPQNHRYFRMKKETIFKEWFPYLKKINPDFSDSSLISCHSSLARYAQPIVPVNYSKLIPGMKTPLPGVYLVNMQMVYPWDRGVNYAIEMGERVAREVSQNEK